MPALPPYATRELVLERLPLIFPEGTPNRTYCVRELSASTVFAALYIGAVEGSGVFLGPIHVYRMTTEQAALSDQAEREAYAAALLKRNVQVAGIRWYADNTREPIRDETLQNGLVAVGAVLAREDLPTTSSRPRYALRTAFAVLFDPAVQGEALEKAIAAFQTVHLTRSALARISIIRSGAAGSAAGVLVTFPNGETRQLAPGPSSIISRAVIEVFARRFLEKPAVLWLSESGNKIVMRDERIANAIGLKIEPDKNLPDLILPDLEPAEPLIVFVEVVATDGAITPRRQEALYALTDAAGFKRSQVAFLTAYQDRESAGFKKTAPQLAWDSFAWFVSEPDNIIILRDGHASAARLSELIGMG
jgi:hypothetical protein